MRSNAVTKAEAQPKQPKKRVDKHAARRSKMTIIKPGDKPANLSHSPTDQRSEGFKKKAEALDGKIVKTIATIGSSFVKLGEYFGEAKDKGYHVALGFNSFTDYLAARYPEKSKTQVYEAMRIVKELTTGDDPAVTTEDLGQMTAANASGLAKLKGKGIKLTPQLVGAAKELPIARFQTEIVLKHDPKSVAKSEAAAGRTIAGAESIRLRVVYDLEAETVAQLNRCAEVAKYVTRDDDRQTSFQDKFLQSMCAEYLSANEAAYEEAKREEEAKGVHAALEEDANERLTPIADDQDESILDEDEGHLDAEDDELEEEAEQE